jgi:hypothetical protein
MLSLFAFENILLSATVSSMFGLHSGGQILGFLKATGASAGLVIFGINELFIHEDINLDIIFYIMAGITLGVLPILKLLNT